MAEENSDDKAFESQPMAGGDGPNSYSKNSTLQRSFIDAAKELLNNAIAEKLEIKKFLPSKTFRITDLGCSTGPNTYLAVENIIEAVKFKYEKEGLTSHIPEFQVFFQDLTANDFNILFQSLPQNKKYYTASVPGSFHDQMFPNDSINIAYSSSAIHWLSRIPASVVDSNNPAWNKGRVHYSNATDEVIEAYKAQYDEDIDNFLKARANEIVCGGLILLSSTGRPDGTSHSEASLNVPLQVLGYSLLDLVRKGVVNEKKFDSFNIPIYQTSPKELSDIVERNGCFRIEMVTQFPVSPVDDNNSIAEMIATHMRAGMEGLLKLHFGEEILDELFDLYPKKWEDRHVAWKPFNFFVVLKRNED